MKFFITEKPQNMMKQHTVKTTKEAISLYKRKVKEFPDKGWMLEDESGNLIKATWADDYEEETVVSKE